MNLVLETDRLLLREMKLSDAEKLYEMDCNPNVHRYIKNKIGRFVVIEKESNELIGWAGLKYNTVEVNNKINFYDIGYRLNENSWGKGYASEVAFAWLDYGFKTMNLNTIMAAAHAENGASNAILKKIGMKFTEDYWEDEVLWNWYELKNNVIK